jgi:PAS domain S-box-containing protein
MSSNTQHPIGAAGESEYRRLANALPQVIWTCLPTGHLEWVNERWMELTGLDAEQTYSEGALKAIHPDDIAEIHQKFGGAIATSTPCEIEYRIRAKEGNYRWHLCRVVPLRDERGAIVRWVAAAFDVHEQKESAEALRASERRFETIFHLNPMPTAVTRLRDGTFLLVNDAFLKVTGYAREELVGRSAIDLGIMSAEARDAIVAPLHLRRRARVEVPFRTKAGKPLRLAVSASRIEFDGEPCVIKVSEDVTEKRSGEDAVKRSEAQARARADELEALMDAVPAGVWLCDGAEGTGVRANRMGRELLGWGSAEELARADINADRRPYRVFADGAEVHGEGPLFRAARGTEVRDREAEILHPDGRVTHLYGNAVPVRDPTGQPRGAIMAMVDVTRLKAAEAALRDADRRKDEFLALLSHELRNPLAPILAAAELMHLGGDVPMPREREVILRQTRHLVRLVDDLLDVSRVASGKVVLNLVSIELSSVVAKAIEAAGALLTQRSHQLTLTLPAEGLAIDVDEVRLTQVVTNLLTNAARYTPPGGRIEVLGSREGNEIVLRVRDNGMGIDPSVLPSLFEMFVQGTPGPGRSEGGLGLGLSLARTFAVMHGGTLTGRSDGPGRGSEFMVRLPISTRPARATPPLGRAILPSALGLASKRVLVVDDNDDAAKMLSVLLAGVGHKVQFATDPVAALSLADGFRPQVAILDIGLPMMDGYALGRELRTRFSGAAPNLIALTGYGQPQDRRRSEEAGFSLHLVKPVNLEILVHFLAVPGVPSA